MLDSETFVTVLLPDKVIYVTKLKTIIKFTEGKINIHQRYSASYSNYR